MRAVARSQVPMTAHLNATKARGRAMRKTVHLTLAVLGVGLATPALADEADWQEVEKALGVSGSMEPGDVYKVGLPRSDLQVTADGVQIKPSFALGSWLAFEPTGGDEAMVMGDLVLTQQEVNPVMARLVSGGIDVTAVHNHLLRAEPATMYMHIEGMAIP